MEKDQLLNLAQSYRDNRDFINNEESAKLALVIPFLRKLGYDPNLPREVRPEFSAEFTQGDGKRYPDKMDFAIFDKTGSKPLMVIETKPLGTDLKAKSQQLARYISQMSDLHFGIITDGCHYYFYGDLEDPNRMDDKPFFSFSLDDQKTDWSKVANFLSKFSRDAFNAETLITDAENSQYRLAMIEKLSNALRAPADDEGFLRWLTADVYKGKRTNAVMTRLSEVAKEAIEPSLLKVIGDEFLDKLKERIHLYKGEDVPKGEAFIGNNDVQESQKAENETKPEEEREKREIDTTQEELDLFENIKSLCEKNGIDSNNIIYKDTINYFNVSYKKPTKWFVRYFGAGRRSIMTLVPTEEATTLCSDFKVEDAPKNFGVSRIYIDDIGQVWALKAVILKSLDILQSDGKETEQENDTSTGHLKVV